MKSSSTGVEVLARDRDEFVDLTSHLESALAEAGIREGLVIAYCRHTTCTLLVNEWEPGALADLNRRLRELVPADERYEHDDFSRRPGVPPDERVNGRAHVAAMVLGGNSQAIPVVGGAAALGTWQRLFLLELDEPKPRRVDFVMVGSG